MVETRLQRKKRQMTNFGQDFNTNIHTNTYDMNQDMTFNDPFTNMNIPSSMNLPTSSRNPFEPFIQRDHTGQVLIEDLDVAAQNPDVASFVEDLVLNDADRYLAMLLDQGEKLPKGFDINTIRPSSPDNTTQNSTPQQNTNNASNNNTVVTTQIATSTINITSSGTISQNTSNSINATSIGGTPTMPQAISQSMPAMSMTSSQTAGTTLGSTSMGASSSNPIFGTSSMTIGTSSSNPYVGTSFNPFGGTKRCILIQGPQPNVNTSSQLNINASQGQNTNIPHGQGTQMTQQMNTFGHQNNQGYQIPQISANMAGSHIPTYSSQIHMQQHIPHQNWQYQQFPNQNISYIPQQHMSHSNSNMLSQSMGTQGIPITPMCDATNNPIIEALTARVADLQK